MPLDATGTRRAFIQGVAFARDMLGEGDIECFYPSSVALEIRKYFALGVRAGLLSGPNPQSRIREALMRRSGAVTDLDLEVVDIVLRTLEGDSLSLPQESDIAV